MATKKTRKEMVFQKECTNVSTKATRPPLPPPPSFIRLKPVRAGEGEGTMFTDKVEDRIKKPPGGGASPTQAILENLPAKISCHGVSVTLDNNVMWNEFFRCQTEMILTQDGSRMFPYCRFRISGLDASKKYSLVVDIQPVDSSQYKWTGHKWQVAGKAIRHLKSLPFSHPDSPSTGQRWMEQPVSFYKLKLTNMSPGQGNLVLHPLHRYIPRLHVVPFSANAKKELKLNGPLVATFTFPQTEFFAVSAYQNSRFTQLKVNYNPFAKGFKDERSSSLALKLKSSASKDLNKEADPSTNQNPFLKKSLKSLPTNHKPRSCPVADHQHSDTSIPAATSATEELSSKAKPSQKLFSELIREAHVSLRRCNLDKMVASMNSTCKVKVADLECPFPTVCTAVNEKSTTASCPAPKSPIKQFLSSLDCQSKSEPQPEENVRPHKRPPLVPLPALARFLSKHQPKHRNVGTRQEPLNTPPSEAPPLSKAAPGVRSTIGSHSGSFCISPASTLIHQEPTQEGQVLAPQIVVPKPMVPDGTLLLPSTDLPLSTSEQIHFSTSAPEGLPTAIDSFLADITDSSTVAPRVSTNQPAPLLPESSPIGFESLSPASSPEPLPPLHVSLGLETLPSPPVAHTTLKWHSLFPQPDPFLSSFTPFYPTPQSPTLNPPDRPCQEAPSITPDPLLHDDEYQSLPFPGELSPLALQLSLSPSFSSLDGGALSPTPSLSDLLSFISTDNNNLLLEAEVGKAEHVLVPYPPLPLTVPITRSDPCPPVQSEPEPTTKPLKGKRKCRKGQSKGATGDSDPVYTKMQPSLEEVEEQLFVSFTSKEALKLHLQDSLEGPGSQPLESSREDPQPATPSPEGEPPQQSTPPPDTGGIGATATGEHVSPGDGLKDHKECVAAFQTILLRDLKLMKNRQVIHPVLQEVGLKMHLLDATLAIDLQYLGVRLPIPPHPMEAQAVSPWAASPPAPPRVCLDFVSRTGKTSDVTQIKGWREKFSPSESSTSSSSSKTEAAALSEHPSKNLSAFCSDMLDEYLENEGKLLDQHASRFSQAPPEPVAYELPTQSSSYVRTLSSVLKKQPLSAPTSALISSFVPPSKRPRLPPTTTKKSRRQRTAGSKLKSKPASDPPPTKTTPPPVSAPNDTPSKKTKKLKSAPSLRPTPKTPVSKDLASGLALGCQDLAPLESDSELGPARDVAPKPKALVSVTLLKQRNLEEGVVWEGRPRTCITEERASIALTSLFTSAGFVREDPTAPIQLVKRRTPPCLNDFCRLGCVCSSLAHSRPITHCGKVQCMLGCGCLRQKVVLLKNLDGSDSSPSDLDPSKRKRRKKRMKMAYVLKETESVAQPAQPVRSLWKGGDVDPEPMYTPEHVTHPKNQVRARLLDHPEVQTQVLKAVCQAMAQERLHKPFWINKYYAKLLSFTIKRGVVHYKVHISEGKADLPKTLLSTTRPGPIGPSKTGPTGTGGEEVEGEEAVEDWQKEEQGEEVVEDSQKEVQGEEAVEDSQKEVQGEESEEDSQKEVEEEEAVEGWQEEEQGEEAVEDWQKEVQGEESEEDWQKEVQGEEAVEDWQKEVQEEEAEEDSQKEVEEAEEDSQKEVAEDKEDLKEVKKRMMKMALPFLSGLSHAGFLSANRKESGGGNLLVQVNGKPYPMAMVQLGRMGALHPANRLAAYLTGRVRPSQPPAPPASSPAVVTMAATPPTSGEHVVLEKVLGITAPGNRALACDPRSGLVAYPAGCVVVLLNPKKNKQHHIFNHSSQSAVSLSSQEDPSTTLAFSPDGKYIVTGESGHMPAVRVWEVSECVQVVALQEHKYGVSCVAFSPNSKYIVSVGYHHDMIINVWSWKKNVVVAANKVSSKVTAVSFSDDSSYFVTAGNRHVKFWYLDHTKTSKVSSTVPLSGRSGLLGELRNNFFSDVACGRGKQAASTYCITSSGLLCEFNDRRLLDKWVELRTCQATCVCVTEELLFCGCADGTVRAFSPVSLHFLFTMPRPHHLGCDISSLRHASQLFASPSDVRYPDTVCVSYDAASRWLSCVYSDHSVYVWDVRDPQRPGKLYSALYHSACVWGLEVCPEGGGGAEGGAGGGAGGGGGGGGHLPLPPGSFLTCSADNTIRLWNADGLNTPRNILSQDLQTVIYTDPSLAGLADTEGVAQGNQEKAGSGTESQTSETRMGLRTLCISPDGLHLASGDRMGILRIHDTENMEEILNVQAHDSEILCLEYSKPDTGLRLLATASRDRLIHVLDAARDYSLLQTLDEHSSSITAVRFAANEGKVRMVSCGADKSIYFRTAHKTEDGMEFSRTHHVVRKTTLYDMDIDSTRKYAAIGCQDRSIRIFNISNGKQKKMYKGSQGEDGTLIKVQTDPSGLYIATSCSDKNISIFNFYSGECVATMYGHSEIVTGMKFTNDCKHLITVSGDSCIFVWRLSPDLTISMLQRLADLRPQNKTPQHNPRRELHGSPIVNMSSDSDKEEEEDEEVVVVPVTTNAYITSCADRMLRGPHWRDADAEGGSRTPRRRWSRRAENADRLLGVQSMLDLRHLDNYSDLDQDPDLDQDQDLDQDLHQDLEQPGLDRPLDARRGEELGSTVSLQVTSTWTEDGGLRTRERPGYIRLSPDVEERVVYPPCWEDRVSLGGSVCYYGEHMEALCMDGNSSDLEEEEEAVGGAGGGGGVQVRKLAPQTPDQEAFLKQHFVTLSDDTPSGSPSRSVQSSSENLSISSRFLCQGTQNPPPRRSVFPFSSETPSQAGGGGGGGGGGGAGGGGGGGGAKGSRVLVSEVRPLNQPSEGGVRKKAPGGAESRRSVGGVARGVASYLSSSSGLRKAKSVQSLMPDTVSLEVCRAAAAELHCSFRRAAHLYTLVSSSSAPAAAPDKQEMNRVLSEAFGSLRAELNTPSLGRLDPQCMLGGEERALDLLERYSQLLLQAVEKKLEPH
ncbi:unnamed protein product [Lota lota]